MRTVETFLAPAFPSDFFAGGLALGGSAGSSATSMETVLVTVLFGNVVTILSRIEAGKEIAESKDRIGPGLHVLRGEYWDNLGDIPRRSIDTVVVDDDRVVRVLDDLRRFYSAMEWYVEPGVP